MKILLVATWYHNDGEASSAGIFHYEQAMCLKQYCDIAIYYPFDTSLKCRYKRAFEDGIEVFRTRWQGGGIGKRADIYTGFARVIQEYRPDIIHAQVASQAGYYSVKEGKIFNIPVIITEHNPIEQMELDNKRAYKRNKVAYQRSRANICVSNDSRDRLKRYFEEESFRTIYNGVMDPDSIEPDGLQYKKDNKVNACIVAGFYSKDIKGYQYLLPAIKKLKEEGTDIVLHVVGGGEYETYYKSMAADLGIDDRCVFYGLCDRKKVYSIMRQMDFSISASIFESAGVSVQEAMLLGIPLVVTKSGGANSLVTEGSAIVVDRNSCEALADGIRRMTNTYAEYDKKYIRNYAYENFEIESVNSKYLELYNEILNVR